MIRHALDYYFSGPLKMGVRKFTSIRINNKGRKKYKIEKELRTDIQIILDEKVYSDVLFNCFQSISILMGFPCP